MHVRVIVGPMCGPITRHVLDGAVGLQISGLAHRVGHLSGAFRSGGRAEKVGELFVDGFDLEVAPQSGPMGLG